MQHMNMQELKELIYQGEKVDIECKKAEKNVPKSAYESYSAFANTKGGYIILGVREDKTKTDPKERFIIQGIEDAPKQKEDFWNTINGNKVNINLLTDDDVKIVEDGSISLVVIHVPRADFNMRPVYVGENPYKGTYKRLNSMLRFLTSPLNLPAPGRRQPIYLTFRFCIDLCFC